MEKRDEVPGLAEKLKVARKTADMSQAEAGEASGVHPISIAQFETGTRTPTLATLYKLAAAYGVNVCELLPGGEEPAPKGKRKK